MATGDRQRNRLQNFRPEIRPLLMGGAIVAVVAFAVGFGVTALNFIRGGAPIDVVTVPDVREMPVDDASRTLDRSDLSMEVGDSFPNPTVPRGSVLAQSPLPGQEVSSGTEVRIIISEGRAAPIVPDVSVLPLALATQTLQATGFSVSIEDAPGEGEEGDVIGTVPEPGTAVHLPATIRLRVGAPPLPVVVPVLLGISEMEAREVADSLGLSVEVDYLPSDEGVPDYTIIGQEPAGGQEAPGRSTLRLQVRGEPPFETEDAREADPDGEDEDVSMIQEGRDP